VRVPPGIIIPLALHGQVPWFRPALLTIVLFTAGCSHRADLTRPATQDNFGVQMAKQNLWREALFRFRRVVQINPSDPMAHNNLAVAYEANGDFDNARKEYLEALRLDRSNQYIQKNYSRFVEFLSRNKKRQQKDVKAASVTPAMPAAGVKAVDVTPAPPGGKPEAVDPAKPTSPPTVAPPVDLPQPQPVPTSPPLTPKPPGGAQ
jgi:tetratricopeptide (TPR) repeat protein